MGVDGGGMIVVCLLEESALLDVVAEFRRRHPEKGKIEVLFFSQTGGQTFINLQVHNLISKIHHYLT